MHLQKRILVTGGAAFIGAAVCRMLVADLNTTVLNVDTLTYAANLDSLRDIAASPRYRFCRADICDRAAMAARTMTGRNGEPADFAGVAVFLASRASDYVTGQTLYVDGGFSVT